MSYLFINPANEYPRHVGDILVEYPEFDGVNLPEGWQSVATTERPETGPNQTAYEVFPELVNGQYVQTWVIRDLTAEEIAAREEAKKNFNPRVKSPYLNNRVSSNTSADTLVARD